MPIENRIRWSGLFITLGVTILLFTLRWSHPLSFLAFLVFGCPLILAGILLFLWALAVKDGTRGTTALCIVTVLLLPLALSACAGGETPAPRNSPQAFDPSTTTARVFGTVSLEGGKPVPQAVTIRQDPFCQANAKAIFKRSGLVTDDGILRNVIVYVRTGYEGRTYPVPSEPVVLDLSLIHISEPTRLLSISYAVFCLK